MSEFLNPKSMITPGVAGGVVMFLVNAIATPFPSLPARWVALAISGLVAAVVVLQPTGMRVFERIVYWTINSIVIFAVSFGSASFARNPTTKSHSKSSALSILVSTAYAQGKTTTHDKSVAREPEPSNDESTLKTEVKNLKEENAVCLDKLEKSKESPSSQRAPEEKRFFKEW